MTGGYNMVIWLYTKVAYSGSDRFTVDQPREEMFITVSAYLNTWILVPNIATLQNSSVGELQTRNEI